MPVGFVVVPGWYFAPAVSRALGGGLPMLPGGMIASGGIFGMFPIGMVFLGTTPI